MQWNAGVGAQAAGYDIDDEVLVEMLTTNSPTTAMIYRRCRVGEAGYVIDGYYAWS
jgi:hypothetical protein